MTQEQVIGNAQLVLDNTVQSGTVVIRDGVIADLDFGHVTCMTDDAEGDFIAPGLIELHTDNLERHISPRPKVDWPHSAAIVAHDGELASVGVTTVFDAMRVGSVLEGKSRYHRYARPLATELLGLRDAGALKISHFLHLRAEVCSETLTEELEEFTADDRVGIVSLMDHTPGQRQFRDMSKLAAYVQGKHGLSDDEFIEHVHHLKELRERYGAVHEKAAVNAATRFGAVLASHDDTTAEQVAISRGHGVRMAEFPTTVEAAQACKQAGVAVIMGGPNLVRGGSHSGNVAAQELAELRCLNILSSDYVPSSLLLGAVLLADIWDDLAAGIATVTSAPAKAVGLQDRGRLDVGLRADLLRFSRGRQGAAVVRAVWSKGKRVA
jgi:alpha-D-ribose 1-methylphosphonate 5-triphosphate diphosphatase